MTSIHRALDLFANGYEEITGDMLHKDLKANVKRRYWPGFWVLNMTRKIWRVHYSRMETVPGF